MRLVHKEQSRTGSVIQRFQRQVLSTPNDAISTAKLRPGVRPFRQSFVRYVRYPLHRIHACLPICNLRLSCQRLS
jgi:hypothetical protein